MGTLFNCHFTPYVKSIKTDLKKQKKLTNLSYKKILFFPQLTEADQELYKNFPLVVSERWQQEVAETVFDAINQDTDKIEQKRKSKPRIDELDENCESLYLVGETPRH